MNKRLKILTILVVVLGLVGMGISVLFYVHQSTQKVSIEQSEIKSQQKVLTATVARLDATLQSIQSDLKGQAASNQQLHDALGDTQNDQKKIKEQVDLLSKKLEEVDTNIQNKIKELTFSLDAIEGRSKGWIKENLATMTIFEDTLNNNSKDLEVIKSRLPVLEKEMAGLKEKQAGASSQDTHDQSALEDKVKSIDQQLKDVQEKTLDVILKKTGTH